MCVIISGINNKPSLADLRACEEVNPDGGGIAWCTDEGAKFHKDLDADEIHALLDGTVPTGARWVVHFRWASIGDVTPGLCHPFPISKDASLETTGVVDRVLFHNGTVSDWETPIRDAVLDPRSKLDIPGGEWSDSRGVAWLLALNESTRGLRFVEGKFIVLNRRGMKVYPENMEGWTITGGKTAENEIWWSNQNWRRCLTGRSSKKSKGTKKESGSDLAFGYVNRGGAGAGRSLVDEAQDLLDEDDAMDLGTSVDREDQFFAEVSEFAGKRMTVTKTSKKGKGKNPRKRVLRSGLKIKQNPTSSRGK